VKEGELPVAQVLILYSEALKRYYWYNLQQQNPISPSPSMSPMMTPYGAVAVVSQLLVANELVVMDPEVLVFLLPI